MRGNETTNERKQKRDVIHEREKETKYRKEGNQIRGNKKAEEKRKRNDNGEEIKGQKEQDRKGNKRE